MELGAVKAPGGGPEAKHFFFYFFFIKPGMLKHLYLKCLMCPERLTAALHWHCYVGGDVCIAHVAALARLKADSADSTEASTNYLASTTPARWLARAGVTNMVPAGIR